MNHKSLLGETTPLPTIMSSTHNHHNNPSTTHQYLLLLKSLWMGTLTVWLEEASLNENLLSFPFFVWFRFNATILAYGYVWSMKCLLLLLILISLFLLPCLFYVNSQTGSGNKKKRSHAPHACIYWHLIIHDDDSGKTFSMGTALDGNLHSEQQGIHHTKISRN
jgi:hypothetical protein